MKDAAVVILSALAVAVFSAARAPDATPAEILDDVALAPYFDDIERQDAGDALLWIDQEGNVAVSIPVERIVYFGRDGEPIGGGDASDRCRKSVATSMRTTAVLCLESDILAPKDPL